MDIFYIGARRMRMVSVLCLLLLLSACQSLPEKKALSSDPIFAPELAYLPENARTFAYDKAALQELIAEQKALTQRNLYRTSAGNLSVIAVPKNTMRVVAHRGHYTWPENSPDAVMMSAGGDFNGAEIDVMLTQDHQWVVHHDPVTGRSVSSWDGKRYRVSRMSSADWNRLQMRDKDGELTQLRAPFATDVFRSWAIATGHGRQLNIEVKAEASQSDLYKLDAMARQRLGEGTYFYSSMEIDVLEKLREINPAIYLGYIWEPDDESISKLKQDFRRAAHSDAAYQDYQAALMRASRYESRYRARHSNKLSAADIANKLGRNAGLHVDIRSLVKYPSMAKRVKQAGLRRLAVYTVNGDTFFIRQLQKLQHQHRALPYEAIADMDKYHLYGQLFPRLIKPAVISLPKQAVIGQTLSLPTLILLLPADADFSRLEQQNDYVKTGFYLTLAGKVRMLFQSRTVKAASAHQSPHGHDGPKIIYDAVKLNIQLAPVEISLPPQENKE